MDYLSESKIIRMPDLDYSPDPRGLGHILHESMLRYKDNVAQVDALTGEKDTYAALLQRSISTAIAMQLRGIKSGDFVSVCTFNHLNSCVPHVASWFINAIPTALDPTMTVSEMSYLLKLVPPKLIFVAAEAVEVVEAALKEIGANSEIVVFENSTKHTTFSTILQLGDGSGNDFMPIEVGNLDDTCLVVFSSGTTDLPKPICHSHYGLMCQNFARLRSGYRLDLVLSYASPYWTVFTSYLIGTVMSGGTRLVLPKFNLETAWRPFDYPMTTLFLNTYQVTTMCAQGRPENVEMGKITWLYTGGDRLKGNQLTKIREMFPELPLVICYGQSETGLVTSFGLCGDEIMEVLSKKPKSCGKAVPGISYKIVDLDTEETLDPNQEGELRVKSKFFFKGYLNGDSSHVWDSNGWLKTGDMAYYDEDGFLFVTGRWKQMFKYQGLHVLPTITEEVLLTHPAVEKAVVVGIPHENDDSHAAGVVVLNSSTEPVTAAEIETYVNERVSDRQKLRAGVKIVDKLPSTPSQKIDRRKIVELIATGAI